MTGRRFTRDPRPVALRGVRTSDVLGLVREPPDASGSRRVIVADLRLGSWRLHQVASELLAQLELSSPDFAPPAAPAGGQERSDFARRADAETSGDRPTLEALQLAERLLEGLENGPATAVAVLLPHRDATVERHDLLLIRLLAEALAATHHPLLLVAGEGEKPNLPRDWRVSWGVSSRRPTRAVAPGTELLALVPGVISAADAVAFAPEAGDADWALPIAGGCVLIDPAVRQPAPAERYDRLAALATANRLRWLAAYAECNGSDEAVDPWFLFGYAADLFRAGACELPLALLTRARPRMPGPGRAALADLLAQAVRIFNERFEDAAAMPDPDQGIPPQLRGMLLHTKGWALTMSSEPEEAERCLAAARDLMGAQADTDEADEYLSLLNISALNRLQQGDWDGAHAIERRIGATLDRRRDGAWQLRYVNSLNLARLHRKRGDWDAAESHYRDAFATVAGVRSDSDAIHANVTLARIEEQRGRFPAALAAWTRAALHWVACDAPEAVAPRVTAAIAAPSDVETHGNIPDATSAALLARLRACARGGDAAALDRVGSDRAPVFLRPEALPAVVLKEAAWTPVLGRGWGVMSSPVATAPVLSSPANTELRAALGGLIAASAPADARWQAGSVLVDDRLGHEIATTEAELAETCLRLGVGLDESTRRALAERQLVRLGSAVDEVRRQGEHLIVSFKRYREPVMVHPPASRILTLVGSQMTVADLRGRVTTGDLPSLLRELEHDRMVEMTLPEAALG